MIQDITKNIPSVLATDLDGTFLPQNPTNKNDLETLAKKLDRSNRSLIFVTGRHFASTQQAIHYYSLPSPDWIICDVGTSIFRKERDGNFQLVKAYTDLLDGIVHPFGVDSIKNSILTTIDHLELQEPEKQSRHKLSFYVDSDHLEQTTELVTRLLQLEKAPYSLIASVDPFNGRGLLDVLPKGVSKAKALDWWLQHSRLKRDSVVFAGDSGNDLTAFQAGFLSIVVGNADRRIANRVVQAHRKSGWNNRLYLAKDQATSGVLEGCRWFGLVR